MKFEVVIIGAGLSGLAAGIRLAHFGKKVLIVEAHHACGGMNSFYRKNGFLIDTGLHALTNFVEKGVRRAPLRQLLKQLRLRYDDLQLLQQQHSRITFRHQGVDLFFANDFSVLRDSVRKQFPRQLDGFDRLTQSIDSFDGFSLTPPVLSGRTEVSRFITDPLLVDMLFTPLLFYGSATEHDIDFAALTVLWKSIYREGFSRPAGGITMLLDLLVNRYLECGGELLTRTQVEELAVGPDKKVREVSLSNGETVSADMVLSSAGFVETMQLCSDREPGSGEEQVGRISFVELILILDAAPASLGLNDSIIFFNRAPQLTFARPEGPVDLSSGTVCCPGNFADAKGREAQQVRISVPASYPAWLHAAEGHDPAWQSCRRPHSYEALKEQVRKRIMDEAVLFLPDFREHVVFSDLFTPVTIKRFTGHQQGAVYGSPIKHRPGTTSYGNLFVTGTDQGFLGIVGSLLSGISVANRHCLMVG